MRLLVRRPGPTQTPMAPSDSPSTPGILYFDPNPTTTKLATAGMQLAGYQVFSASTPQQAIQLCRQHGPGGDGCVVALLLDTATSPSMAASTLRALVQVPGTAELPGILLVSRANPTPIPGAEGLPSLKRPFTIPALHKVLRESIDAPPPVRASHPPAVSETLRRRLKELLRERLPEAALERSTLDALASALTNESTLPTPATGVAICGDLAIVRIESVLHMLATDGIRGVLSVEHDERCVRLHVDQGLVRLADVHGSTRDGQDLRLGRFLVHSGFLSAELVESIARVPDPHGRMLGQRLVDGGHLRPGDLAQALSYQAREVIGDLLGWPAGRFTFAPTTHLHPLAAIGIDTKIELRMAEALLDALRRRHEEAAMGPHMAGVDDVFLRIDTKIAQLGRQAFTREELGILELLNGRHSVKEIARKTRSGTFSVATVLYRLTQGGLVRQRIEPLQT